MHNNRAVLYARVPGDSRKQLVKKQCPGANGAMVTKFSTATAPASGESENAGEGMTFQYQNLCECAAFRGLEVVDEVIVCEPNDTLARQGWREAVRLALEKDADTILITSSTCVSRDDKVFKRMKDGLDLLGIHLAEGKP